VQLVVLPNGTAKCLYGEEIELDLLGSLTIQRGSHVEPNVSGQWLCDLSPVQGPTLGPFTHRSEALAVEQAWLAEYWLVPHQ
jgi:hypothetical protein